MECICSTSSGVIYWSITSNETSEVNATISNNTNNCYEEKEGYTFTCYNESLKTSQLSFKLSHSQIVHIECSNGDQLGNRSTTITDAG